MIIIKNLQVFNCSINESFHWSKLVKLKETMNNERFQFPSFADLGSANLRFADLSFADLGSANLGGANLSGAKLEPINNQEIIIEDFMIVTGLGSCNRQTIIFDTNIGIVLQCGCFYGTEKAFKKQVREVHGGTNYEKEYMEMLKLAKIRFNRDT